MPLKHTNMDESLNLKTDFMIHISNPLWRILKPTSNAEKTKRADFTWPPLYAFIMIIIKGYCCVKFGPLTSLSSHYDGSCAQQPAVWVESCAPGYPNCGSFHSYRYCPWAGASPAACHSSVSGDGSLPAPLPHGPEECCVWMSHHWDESEPHSAWLPNKTLYE